MAKASSTQPVDTPATSSTRILILRKGSRKIPKVTKARLTEITDALRVARVQRPNVVEFFLSGEFASLTVVPQSVIDNPLRRREEFPDAGWVIPATDLGREPKKGERDWHSTSQSILLWVKKYLCDTGWLEYDDIAVVVESVEG